MGSILSVLRPEPATPANITYSVDAGEPKTEEFDFVVVACDPRGLNIADRTSFEQKINDSLHSHTFHTSLFSAKRPITDKLPPEYPQPDGPPQTKYAVRFDPDTLESMDGGMYGFRDEVMARDESFKPSKTGSTWAVTYQLENQPLLTRQKEDVERKMNVKRDAAIKENDWVDWVPEDATATKEITVDYFAHFKQEHLREGMPWKLIDEQGKNKTLYIASFTCFESVLHCYLYQNMLMKRAEVQAAFPRDRAARIAVIGAGPSGLLFASQHLAAKGYTNFKIFESTDRYGGKTVTQYQPIPGSPDKSVPCELGTCYLSPAYFPLYGLFEKYDVGDVLSLDRDSNQFRSIIDRDVARSVEEKVDGVEFGAWSGHLKNGHTPAEGAQRILRGTVLLILFHVCAMGMDPEDALPARKPSVVSVLQNVANIIHWIATNLDDVAKIDESFSLSSLFKGILFGGGLMEKADDEMRRECEEVMKEVEEHDLDIDLHDIVRLFSVDLFKKTFGELLDDLDIADLKPTLVYAYQVQGYGTVENIPALYGLLWITPFVFLNQILSAALPAKEGSERDMRGTVNVLSKGWYNVWTKIVEKDLPPERFCFNAKISSIDRKLSK